MLAAIAALGTKMGQIDPDRWLVFLVLQIGLGPVAGIAVGQIGGRLLRLRRTGAGRSRFSNGSARWRWRCWLTRLGN